MPLWGTRRSGGNSDSTLNFVSLIPGDDFALLDGTETVVSGSKSTAFARGGSCSQSEAMSTFWIKGCSNGSTVTIQSSNGVVGGNQGAPSFTLATLDATFGNVFVSTGNGPYSDEGTPAFYRAVVTTLIAGDAPIVTVKR